MAKHGGKRRGSGRTPDAKADQRARLVHLYEAEHEAEGGKRRRQVAVETVAQALDEPHETVRSSARSRDKRWDRSDVSVIAEPGLIDNAADQPNIEEREGFRGIIGTASVPGWPMPEPPPQCTCDDDPIPHWHCAACGALLTVGIPLMGSMDERGKFDPPVLACSEPCRSRAVAQQPIRDPPPK